MNSVVKVSHWILLVLIVTASLAAAGYKINEPMWEEGHHGFHMSEYPHNARNYLRFGYLQTKLGLAENFGVQIPADGFDYRVDHGFITPFLISISYHLFGIQNWSARLAPLLFTMSLGIVTFLLTSRLTGNRWGALLALFFFAFSPLILYFGRMPAPHIMAALFAFLDFYLYWRWFQTKQRRYLVGVFIVLALGTHTNWVMFFVVPPIILHYLIFWPTVRNWRFVVMFALSPFALFGTYLMWVFWLEGVSSLTFLWDKFLFRTVSSEASDNPYLFTMLEWWHISYGRAFYWLTTPVVVLTVGWLLGISKKALANRHISAAHGLVVALFLFGFSHNILFGNRVLIHDFIMYYHLVPAFAIAATLALMWLIKTLTQTHWILAALVALITGGLFLEQSSTVYQHEHNEQAILTDAYYIGKSLNSLVSPTGHYLDAANLSNVGARRAYVIADRPNHRIQTLENFQQLMTSNTPSLYEAIIVQNSDGLDIAFRQHLVETYHRQEVAGHSIFSLSQKESNTFVDTPDIDTPRQFVFDDQIEYLGFSADPIVYRKSVTSSWLSTYFTPHAELLPENLTTIKITNYWRKISPEPMPIALTTHLSANNTDLDSLKPIYRGLTDLYPPGLWPVNRVIRQELEIIVPPDYPNAKYDLEIGVQQDDNFLRPAENGIITTDANTVAVGQIDLRPSQPPPSLPILPKPQTKTNILIDNQLELYGYTVDNAETGLTVTTFWQKLGNQQQDYQIFIKLMGLTNSLMLPLETSPSRLWLPDQFYSGKTTVSPHLLSEKYELELVVQNETGGQQNIPLAPITWCQPTPRPVFQQIGQPDNSANDAFRLESDETFTVVFSLPYQQNVEILIGWSGKSQHQETRIQAFVENPDWLLGTQKYLTTLAVGSRQPTVSQIQIPARLTVSGYNTVNLIIPEQALTGWRAWLATLIPDTELILRSSLYPTNGWIDVDFVQVLPIDAPKINQLENLSPIQLVEAYNYLQDNQECLNISGQETIVNNIQSQLQQVNWGTASENTLIYAQAHGPPALQQEIQTHLSKTFPSNVNQTLVDRTSNQKLRVLGYTIEENPRTLELDIFIQALDNLEEDYTATLYAQNAHQKFLFDNHLPTTTWEPGRIYNISLRNQAAPGNYELSLFIEGNYSQQRLHPQNSTTDSVSLGQQRVR